MRLVTTHCFIQHTVQAMALLFKYCISRSPVPETHGNRSSPVTRKIRQIFIRPRTPKAKNYYLYFKLCRYLCHPNRSASFSVSWDGEAFTFDVTGYGHGVGMSQYGANAMAREGSDFEEILTWYYTGTEVGELYGAAGE